MGTIRDIAKKAGVSISTVSLVLNNKGYVKPETRQKIINAIQELNYKPSRSARKLATRTNGNIGFIIWESHFYEVEMFYSQVFLGMEYAARRSDSYILLTTVKEEFDPKTDLPRFLKYNDVDGVALAGRVPHELALYLENERIPFVLVDYNIPGKKYNSVQIDNYNGAYSAVQHLIESGRRRIGFVGGTFFHSSIKERYRGLKECIEHYQIMDADQIARYTFVEDTETSPAIGEKGISSLLKNDQKPDAVFCCNDTTAMGVIKELHKRQIKIPDDIAVVGFDDIPNAAYSAPRLTTVKVPKLVLGKEAFNLLNEVIENPLEPPQTRIIATTLVKRESTGVEE
ncbi:MAG: LacI family DNA-binding transcriptional regulator [Candidatus Neomarinimicrobiota bacterium]|jgi:LacI family transcriptional regulator|nr:LacI family DNA-binding transcriptional regulator [Candidatus Neomarinimicrobiota bacterium]